MGYGAVGGLILEIARFVLYLQIEGRPPFFLRGDEVDPRRMRIPTPFWWTVGVVLRCALGALLCLALVAGHQISGPWAAALFGITGDVFVVEIASQKRLGVAGLPKAQDTGSPSSRLHEEGSDS